MYCYFWFLQIHTNNKIYTFDSKLLGENRRKGILLFIYNWTLAVFKIIK